MNFLRFLRVALVFGALAVFAPLFPARAEGTFIAAPGRTDFVHDPARGLIYISSGSQVLRFRVADQTFLAPFEIGKTVRQLDLAPDSSFLVGATPNSLREGKVGFAYIDLNSGVVSDRWFIAAASFGSDATGTGSIALDNAGAALVTTSTLYGGWAPAPMRYDFATDTAVSTAQSGAYNSFYSPSVYPAGDRSVIGLSENGISSGPFSRIAGGALTRLAESGTYNSGLAVSSDGAQFAIPTYQGTAIFAGARKLKTLGRYADEQGIGAAYHPARARLYLPWSKTSQVRVFDAGSFAQIGAYDFETTFEAAGFALVHVSRDGSLLGANVPGGVRYVNLNSDAPRPLTAHGANIDLDEDSSATFDLSYSGGAPGAAASFAIVKNPQRGTLSGQGATRIYTPAPNAYGPDELTFRVTQGAATSTARVFIDIRSVNDAPVVADVAALARRNRAVQIKATATDVDASYGSFNWRVWAPPLHGSATIADPLYVPAATFTYTPAPGFVGTDSFQIIANDSPTMGFYNGAEALDSAPATVTVTVADNGAPVANPDSYVVSADEPLSLAAPGVLANDSDPEGDALTAVLDPNTRIANGSIDLKADGSFTWTPDYWSAPPAQMSFRYAAKDAFGAGDWTTVTLQVAPPLRANAQNISVPEDGSKAVTLTGSGTGVLSYSIVSQPSKGLLSGSAPNLIYTPFANYCGPDSFVFGVQNEAGKRASATVAIDVTPAPDVPVAFDGDYDVEGSAPTAIWLRAFDGDDNALAFTIAGSPAHGTLTASQVYGPNNTRAYIYQAEAGYLGDDALTFRVYDGGYTSNTATVRLHVRAPGSGAAPLAVADNYGVARGQTLRVGAPGVLLNDSDAAGAPLRAVLDRGPKYAALFEFNGDGSFRYAGGVFSWQGNYAADSFTYHVSNGTRNSESVTVTLNVAAIAATSGALTLEANSSAAIALDASGPRPLSYLVGAPAHGTLSGEAPDLIYTPDANYWGADSFTFRAKNGDLSSPAATIAIRVLAPWSVADSSVAAFAGVATPFRLSVSDAGNRAALSLEMPPAHGTLSGTLSGTAPDLVYTPDAGYAGADSLVFAATVGQSRRTATVTFAVKFSNRAPVATPQSVTVDQDDELALALKGTDADGDALSFAVERDPAHGTLSGSAPDLVYTPDAGYVGADSFGFAVSDGVLSGRAEVSIRVAYVSHAPVARADAYQTLEDQPLGVAAPGVLSNDSDANGDALTAVLRSQPTNGRVTLNGDGSFTYLPDAGYFGEDSFLYAAFDGALSSADVRVTIRVVHLNRAPTATPQNLTAVANVPLAIALTGTDPDGDALTYEIVSAPQNGVLSGEGATRTFTPAAGFVGATSFRFRVIDAAGAASGAATVNIAVKIANRAPVATPQSATLLEDASKSLTLRATDADGGALQYEIAAAPQHGVLSGTGDSRTYRPDANYFGDDSFSFVARDSGGLTSEPAPVALTIVPVNDAPAFGLAGSQVTAAKNAGVQTVANFARQISPGNAYEDGQTLTFLVSNSNGSLWSQAPQISPNGTLTYKSNPGKTGTVTVTVTLRDNGGTSNGGRDTSTSRTFKLTIR